MRGHKMNSFLNLLVIDDLQEHRKNMQALLNRKGFKTYIAQSGNMAVKRFREHRINGILADMHMDKMDGVETIRKIREYDKYVPVIAITAYDMNDYKPRAEELNITEWVNKPITEKKFDRIGNLFYETIYIAQKKRLREELATELKYYIQDTLPETIDLINKNKQIVTLIRDVFAREVPEMWSCIDLLLSSRFNSTAHQYKRVQAELCDLIDKL